MVYRMDMGLRYSDHRPYLLPARLEELTGPTSGKVELPADLDWSGARRVYDLGNPAERNILYERVIREAMTVEDLGRYLNAGVLARIWRHLYLPPRLRREWERRFPQLARAVA
jgi:hypothetical protein